MRRDANEFDPTLPALLVTYGNTSKKHRQLDGDVVVLGRAGSCDFTLLSPEVAPVHCLLVRVKDGWKLRDCSGRPGTRVNGKPVQETLLDDGDVIQIGAFSFQAHLPAVKAKGSPRAGLTPEKVARLERSRRRLAERALSLRRQLHKRTRVDETAFARLSAERSELEKQAEALRVKQRDFDLRMTRLELSERDLATDRATLEKEYRTLQDDMERHSIAVRLFREESKGREQELEGRRIAVQAEVHQLWQEWQQRKTVPVAQLVADPPEHSERGRELELRARELEHYARHLRRLRKQLEQAATPDQLVSELRELLAGTKKSRRDRKGRRETKAEKSDTQVNMENTAAAEARTPQLAR